MGFFLLGPLLAVPPLAVTLAYDTGVPVSAESEDVLSGLATSSCPLRRRQAVQEAETSVSFRRGPSDVERDVRLAPQQIHQRANLHFGVALVGRRVAAITVDTGEDLRVALLV